jgi:hypothetical protein
MGDSHVGLQARLMSRRCASSPAIIKRSNAMRHLHQPDPHEDRRDVRQPETTTGGNALKFYSSVRSTSAASAPSRRATRSSATETRVKVVKNKVAPPFKQVRVRHPLRRGHHLDEHPTSLTGHPVPFAVPAVRRAPLRSRPSPSRNPHPRPSRRSGATAPGCHRPPYEFPPGSPKVTALGSAKVTAPGSAKATARI